LTITEIGVKDFRYGKKPFKKFQTIADNLRKVIIEGMACQLPSHALNYNLP